MNLRSHNFRCYEHSQRTNHHNFPSIRISHNNTRPQRRTATGRRIAPHTFPILGNIPDTAFRTLPLKITGTAIIRTRHTIRPYITFYSYPRSNTHYYIPNTTHYSDTSYTYPYTVGTTHSTSSDRSRCYTANRSTRNTGNSLTGRFDRKFLRGRR